jgi:ribosome biogenesis protein Nip4
MHESDELTANSVRRMEAFLNGRHLFLYEYNSDDMIQKIIEKLSQDYGLALSERCHSMCG